MLQAGPLSDPSIFDQTAPESLATAHRSNRGSLRHYAIAVACALCLAGPAWGANSGGSVDTDCGPDYIGTCSTDSSPAQGADVWIDTSASVLGVAVVGGDNTGDGDVIGNRVRVGGSDTFDSTDFLGGSACDGNAINNTLIISGKAHVNGPDMVGGDSCGGNAQDNTVIIRDQASVTSNSEIYGGRSSDRDATGNTVTIRDHATMTGASQTFGGFSIDGKATGNTIIIRDHAVITGATSITGGYSNSENASNNTVIIRDQARVEADMLVGGVSANGTATHNRVILQGSPVLTGTNLAGGISDIGGDAFTGNTLEIHGTGLRAASVQNFAHYQYILPPGVSTDTPVLTLSGDARLADATATLDLAPGTKAIASGTPITLIHSDTLTSTHYTSTPTYITGQQGLALSYRWGLTATDENLIATVDEVRASEQSKAPTEGRVVTLTLINQGGDMIAGTAMDRARAAVSQAQWGSFGAIGGGSFRYNSGSHVDVDGLSVVLGAARRMNTDYGSLTGGAFLEAGYGNYSSYNEFSSGKVRGSGKSRYYGAGLMARQDFSHSANTDPRGTLGPYAEASLRLGRISTDWNSTDLATSLGQDVSYDSTVPYYGAHVGVGTVIGLGKRTSADLYAKYFWSHQDGDQVSIAGDTFRFGSTDSHRIRVGTRVGYVLGVQSLAYAGAAWEHEFQGSARATVYGLDAPSPSLKGDTGVFELGLDIKPSTHQALTVSLGMQAYVGKREGLGGSAQLRYAF